MMVATLVVSASPRPVVTVTPIPRVVPTPTSHGLRPLEKRGLVHAAWQGFQRIASLLRRRGGNSSVYLPPLGGRDSLGGYKSIRFRSGYVTVLVGNWRRGRRQADASGVSE